MATLWALCLFLALRTLASSTFQFPPQFTRYRHAASAVAGDLLFVDGGELWYTYIENGAQSETEYALGSTIYISLSNSWTNSSVELNYVTKPNDFHFARDETIWYNPTTHAIETYSNWIFNNKADNYDNEVWFGDGTDDANNPYKIDVPDGPSPVWSLSRNDGKLSWGTDGPQPDNGEHGFRLPLYTTHNENLYALGGWFDTGNTEQELSLPGMTTVDFSDNTWKNASSEGYGLGGMGYGSYGQAVYSDVFGDEGVIIFIGGYAPSQFFTLREQGGTLQPMSDINIYDIASGTFVTQTATGRIPIGRWSLCAQGVSEADSGTLDIFMFGGFQGLEWNDTNLPQSLGDMYILSLPSFIWTDVPYSTQQPRGGHTCQIIGNRQFVSIGGDNPGSQYIGEQPDPWQNTIGIFDTSSWQWTSGYDPNAAPYTRHHDLVAQTKKTPYPNSWGSAKARKIFSGTVTESGGDNGGGSDNTAAIAGGVGGGVGALLIIAAIIGCLWWRKRKNKKKREREGLGTYEKPELSSTGNRESALSKGPSIATQSTPQAELGPARSWELEGQRRNERYELMADPVGYEVEAAQRHYSQRHFTQQQYHDEESGPDQYLRQFGTQGSPQMDRHGSYHQASSHESYLQPGSHESYHQGGSPESYHQQPVSSGSPPNAATSVSRFPYGTATD